jgi:hypothetical protein
MKHSAPLIICGDLHNQSEGIITRSGNLDLSKNPVISICSGSPGTGPRMWPSAFRGLVAEPPTDIAMEEKLSPVEKNGFVIVDIDREKMVIDYYAWREPEPVEKIDSMEPYRRTIIRRR